MAKSNKKIVKDFLTSDFFNDPSIQDEFLHPDMELYWNAKTGYSHLRFQDVSDLLKEAGKSYDATRAKITHLIGKGEQVISRFTLKVSTIEDPEKMDPIAHFMVIWEVKDSKLYRGYMMSQPSEEDPDAMKSWK